MAMQRPVSERILPRKFVQSRGLKRLGEKKTRLDGEGASKKDSRKFRIVAGGGAYGLRRALDAPPSSNLSFRTPTPTQIPATQPSLRASTSRSRLILRSKPLPSARRPLKRQLSVQGLSQRKGGFSPEYLRELGNMLRLQVRPGGAGNRAPSSVAPLA